MNNEPHGCTHKVAPGAECKICAAYADRLEYRRSLGLPKQMAEPSERVAQSAKELNFAMAMAEFAFRRCEKGWNWEKTLEAILANVTPVRPLGPRCTCPGESDETPHDGKKCAVHDCPCGGFDCSALPGGPLPDCPYTKQDANSPTHEDLCILSRIFNDRDIPIPHGANFRINEWLKAQIAATSSPAR